MVIMALFIHFLSVSVNVNAFDKYNTSLSRIQSSMKQSYFVRVKNLHCPTFLFIFNSFFKIAHISFHIKSFIY